MINNDGFLETILVDIWNSTDVIVANTKQITTLILIGIALLLIVGIMITVNQIQIRKQLRRIQEQLEQKDKPE